MRTAALSETQSLESRSAASPRCLVLLVFSCFRWIVLLSVSAREIKFRPKKIPSVTEADSEKLQRSHI